MSIYANLVENKIVEYGLIESIGIGYNETINALELLIKSIVQMFKGNISFKLGPLWVGRGPRVSKGKPWRLTQKL